MERAGASAEETVVPGFALTERLCVLAEVRRMEEQGAMPPLQPREPVLRRIMDAYAFCVHFPPPLPPARPCFILPAFSALPPCPPFPHYRSKSMSSVTVLLSGKPRRAA